MGQLGWGQMFPQPSKQRQVWMKGPYGPMNFPTFLSPTQALGLPDPQSLTHVLQERRALERKAAELEEELKVNMHRRCGLWALPAQGH